MPENIKIEPWDAVMIRCPVDGGCEVAVLTRGSLTRTSVDRLIAFLQLTRDTYPEEGAPV